MKIFSSGWIREIPEGSITPLATLQNRSRLLGAFAEKKIGQEETDFPGLVRIISMGTGRIIADMNRVIDAMEEEEVSGSERAGNTVVMDMIDESRSRTIALFRKAVSEISEMHVGLDSPNPTEYIERYKGLQERMQGVFQEIRSEQAGLVSRLQRDVPGFSLKNRALSFIKKSQDLIVGTLKKVAKVVGIGTLALSLATANAYEASGVVRSVSGKITQTMERQGNIANMLSSPFLKAPSEDRSVFRMIHEHPEKLSSLARFEERLNEIKSRMKQESMFSSAAYKTGDFEAWNKEIARTLLPTVSDITPEEATIIAKALQMHLKSKNPDGQFGPSSKKALFAHFSGKKSESARAFPSSQFSRGAGLRYSPDTALPGLVLKQILPEHFEEKLMTLVGTKYRKGVSDCSGILKTAMRSLGVIDDSFEGTSRDIISKLTVDKRKASEVRPGDFFYWVPARNPQAHHIAYVSSVEDSGVWIIDSSTDYYATTKRFLPWRTVLKKKWAIVGAAKFLVQSTLPENSEKSA